MCLHAKILVVDDEPLARKRIKAFNLEKHGITIVAEASNGCEALEIMEKTEVDILVTDIVMPRMDGLELLEKIQKKKDAPEVVILTCHSDFEKAQKAIKYGARDYIVKTMLKENEFVEVINKVYDSIKLKKELENKVFKHSIADLIIDKNFDNKAKLINRLKEIGFLPEKYMFTVLYLTDFLEDSFERELLNKQYSNNDLRFELIKIDQFYYVALLFIDKKNSVYKFSIALDKCLSSLETDIREYSLAKDIKYKMISGPIYHDIKDIYDAFKQIPDMIKFTYYVESFKTVSYKHLNNFSFGIYPDFNDNLSKFKNAIVNNNFLEFSFYIKEWLSDIEKSKPPMERVIKMAVTIAAIIPTTIKVRGENGDLVVLSNYLMEAINGTIDFNSLRTAFSTLFSEENYFVDTINNTNLVRTEIKDALQYIEKNYHLDISMPDVAKHVNLSPSWFGALFKSQTEKSFTEYLIDYRINIAKQLLINTDMEIYRISEKIGIKNSHYFSTFFSKTTGLSPLDFRNKHKKSSTSGINKIYYNYYFL